MARQMTYDADTLREVAAIHDDDGTRHDEVADMLRYAATLAEEVQDLLDDKRILTAQLAQVAALPGQWREESAEMLELAKDQYSLVLKVAYEREASDSERRADELDAILKDQP